MSNIEGNLRMSFHERMSVNHVSLVYYESRIVFKRKAVRRLVTTLIGVTVSSYMLIYVIAWAAMPVSLAEQWSGHEVTYATLDVWPNISLPLVPYIEVSTLFTIVAVVGFLAFSLTEEQYSTALAGAIIDQLAERLLLMALPYYRIARASEMEDMSDRESREGPRPGEMAIFREGSAVQRNDATEAPVKRRKRSRRRRGSR